MQQHWEEKQRERNEVRYLKTKTEQQQDYINRLTAEKHEQDLFIKRLSSQVENVIKKLEEKKNEVTHQSIINQQELDHMFQMAKKDMRELEVMNNEMEIKKKHLVKIMRMSRKKEEQYSKMKYKTKEDMDERSEHKLEVEMKVRGNEQGLRLQQEQNNTQLKRVILEVEEIREMLCVVREEIEQGRRDSTEGKSLIKWMNFQAKIKKKTEQQREKLEQKLEDTIKTILSMGEMKMNKEKVAAEINNTREEMLQTQKEMQNHKEEVKKYMVS